ncbi:hypothetical protein H6P81_011506 [Aristolochia fimbriata]|uniref:Uncharacterized protein n=1 Tax=Aristolochia fimbriata TaxID=158543 RepID=A0AAV7EUM3_ARIFI|nr:hypothetical protein H6P81_011506 [Aristolochia fimbriata]
MCSSMENINLQASSSDRLGGFALSAFVCTSMALKAAINLKVFEIISNSGATGASLSAAEITAQIPTNNPNAAAALERILRILAANSLLTVSYKDEEEAAAYYGLSSWVASLVPHGAGAGDGASCVEHYLLNSHETIMAGLHRLEDAVMEEGAVPFERAHGMKLFELMEKESTGFRKVFHDAMNNVSAMVMARVFEIYDVFEKVKEIVDVGGGSGTCVAMIVSKYPHIRAINFDLPYVIANAPRHPGVTHVAGDMFQSVPKASDTIFMKCILHSWNDDKCVKLLRKCWEALPAEGGKVVVVEYVVPSTVRNDMASLNSTTHDILMMGVFLEGKERTLKEFRRLSQASGFAEMKNFPVAHGIQLLEFHKRRCSTTA